MSSEDLRQLLAAWTAVVDAYSSVSVSETRDQFDKENTESDDWHQRHYFEVGREALEIVIAQLIANGRRPPNSLLDFPSGSGRVTRHFRAAFPSARIGACDLYEPHVKFCADEFAAEPIVSRERLDEVPIRAEWDVVFVGSLLTHLPKQQSLQALRFVARALSPTGVAIVTLEGRRSIELQQEYYQLIPAESFKRIQRGYRFFGFGFSNYDGDMKRRFSKNASYGSTFIRPDWIAREVTRLPDVRLLGYAERAWDDHQDYVVFGRPGPTGLGH